MAKNIVEMDRMLMAERALLEMEELARRLRDTISAQPPKDLLGYIYGQRSLRALRDAESEPGASVGDADAVDSDQFLLEYVHAVLAATPEQPDAVFDEESCANLHDVADRLRRAAMMYAVASSIDTDGGLFGPKTGEVEFHAKGAWVLLRGHRYQVLEEEFYAYVLAPHDEVLRETYGVGALEIAKGFQAMANASRAGQGLAAETLAKHFEAAQAFAAREGVPFGDVAEAWIKEHADDMKAAALAMDDMVRGGICNVSRHTELPAALLSDLAFERGEETEFFADGPLVGTPFRTLPARKKPLIRLDGEYYAVDPCFTRDAGYRALLYNLLQRQPAYKKTFEERQKVLTEGAFVDILQRQLAGAQVYQEVYYRHPETRQWVENDTLVLLDDLLVLVEAKSGAAATVASPAADFQRHAQAVQDLVVKAYEQCRRFFNYLASAEEVPIFRREQGKYIECGHLRQSDYRIMLPVGLTVESFSPFSAMCKELPGITPLLGKHAFISMSIDDLFVLNRFLPTAGELAHYWEVRQAVAGKRGAMLFDELDHLGAYIRKNRFDMDIRSQLAKSKVSFVVWDGMSDVVDQHFTRGDWNDCPIPRQEYPEELSRLLEALDRTRHSGWLKVESQIRTCATDSRDNLARTLHDFRLTLDDHEARYFHLIGKPGLFVWLQRNGTEPDLPTVRDKAAASALAMGSDEMVAVIAWASAAGQYSRADYVEVTIPNAKNEGNAHIYEHAARMRRPGRLIGHGQPPARRPGRNDPCWCGSGIKFKRCHGR